jgi:O-methyltransferase
MVIKQLIKKTLSRVVGKRAPFLRAISGVALFDQYVRENSSASKLTEDKYKLYDFLNLDCGEKPYTYLEFGVFEGNSIKYFAKINQQAESKFYGFDCFEGLPEAWHLTGGGVMEKGTFDVNGAIPKTDDTRIHFVKGIFQNSLIPFLEEHHLELTNKPKLIHLDADLYSSEMFCLSQLYRYLENGDVIFFDDFFVVEHDFRTLMDWSKSHLVEATMIAHTPGYGQAAFRIEKKTTY